MWFSGGAANCGFGCVTRVTILGVQVLFTDLRFDMLIWVGLDVGVSLG